MASCPLFIFHFYLCLLMYQDHPCSASSLNNNQKQSGPHFLPSSCPSVSSAALIAMNLVTQFFHQDVHSRGVRERAERGRKMTAEPTAPHTHIKAHITAHPVLSKTLKHNSAAVLVLKCINAIVNFDKKLCIKCLQSTYLKKINKIK